MSEADLVQRAARLSCRTNFISYLTSMTFTSLSSLFAFYIFADDISTQVV